MAAKDFSCYLKQIIAPFVQDILSWTKGCRTSFCLRQKWIEIVCVVLALLVPPFAPRDALHSWQEKNRRWLELTDVHRETTSNIRITVMPFYMGTKVQKKLVILCKAGLIVCEIIINNNYWKCHLAPQNVVGRENEQRNFCCVKQVDETKSTTVCSLLFFFCFSEYSAITRLLGEH